MSVIGSALAITLAIQFGYSTVLLAGGVAYGVAGIVALLAPS